MYALLYIFVCQLSSAVDFENGRKCEVRCGGCWWPCATASAVRRTMVEPGRRMVKGIPSFARLKRGIGADLTGCYSAVKTAMIYIHVLNHGSGDVRTRVTTLRPL